MKPYTYSSGDYAGFESGKIKAYYGYEYPDPRTEEWTFKVWKGDKEVFSATNSELLEHSCGESPEAMLIAGLALYLGK